MRNLIVKFELYQRAAGRVGAIQGFAVKIQLLLLLLLILLLLLLLEEILSTFCTSGTSYRARCTYYLQFPKTLSISIKITNLVKAESEFQQNLYPKLTLLLVTNAPSSLTTQLEKKIILDTLNSIKQLYHRLPLAKSFKRLVNGFS